MNAGAKQTGSSQSACFLGRLEMALHCVQSTLARLSPHPVSDDQCQHLELSPYGRSCVVGLVQDSVSKFAPRHWFVLAGMVLGCFEQANPRVPTLLD